MTKTLTIKPGDIVKTREGRDALIYCTDSPGSYPIHGRLQIEGGPLSWTIDGLLCAGCVDVADLILPKPPAREPMRIWVNFYEDGFGMPSTTKESAVAKAGHFATRTAVPFIEVMEDDNEN